MWREKPHHGIETRHYGVDAKHHGILFDRCDRWWIAGIEQVPIPAILIVVIARIVHACFHKIAGIAGIAGVVHSDPNDRNDYMETRLNTGFHVLALSETKVDNDVPDQIIDIGGYKIERKDRTSRGWGGIAIYLRDYLNYTVRRDIVEYGLEIICVEIKPLQCRPFIIVAWYRPPNDPVISFDLLEKVLSSLDREEKEIILMGDTNCDFSDKAIDSDYSSMHLSNFVIFFLSSY